MIVTLGSLVADFATAFRAVDATHPQDKTYRPGIGPLTEERAVTMAVTHLQGTRPSIYAGAGPMPYPGSETRRTCDLVLPGQWAIEFKLLRPFGDNGKEAEHWSKNVLHPYPGNTSSIGDCLKLRDSKFTERKAIIVFGFEHTPPQIPLEVAIHSFEVIARQVTGIELSERSEAEFLNLVHPYHQQGKVFGWEIL